MPPAGRRGRPHREPPVTRANLAGLDAVRAVLEGKREPSGAKAHLTAWIREDGRDGIQGNLRRKPMPTYVFRSPGTAERRP